MPPIRTTHIYTVSDPDGAALLDTERGQITTLNPTGAFVWQGLERGEGVEAIAASLARQTNLDVAQVTQDVLDFIDGLKAQRLL